jgi:hypothetical protein
LQSAHSHGHIHKCAEVLLPQLAQEAGRRDQQVCTKEGAGHAPHPEGFDRGPGGQVVGQQEQANQLADIVPGDRAARLFGEIGHIAIVIVIGIGIGIGMAVGLEQAWDHGVLERVR